MSDKGVIFDMDGVLVNSYHAHYESWRILGRHHGREIAEQAFAATFGQTSREIIRGYWGDTVSGEQVAQFDHEKEALYRDILKKHFPEMPGVCDLLTKLHEAGFSLAIGSSGPPENVQVVREGLRTGGLFQASVNGMDVKHGKPEPDIFLAAAGKLNLPPNRCAVVEDAPVGVEAARRAGMTVVAITGTATREKLAAADLVIDNFSELSPETIEQIIEKRC
jgi:beta-phosphoglucomutase